LWATPKGLSEYGKDELACQLLKSKIHIGVREKEEEEKEEGSMHAV
jgi:hypothetical protein